MHQALYRDAVPKHRLIIFRIIGTGVFKPRLWTPKTADCPQLLTQFVGAQYIYWARHYLQRVDASVSYAHRMWKVVVFNIRQGNRIFFNLLLFEKRGATGCNQAIKGDPSGPVYIPTLVNFLKPFSRESCNCEALEALFPTIKYIFLIKLLLSKMWELKIDFFT